MKDTTAKCPIWILCMNSAKSLRWICGSKHSHEDRMKGCCQYYATEQDLRRIDGSLASLDPDLLERAMIVKPI